MEEKEAFLNRHKQPEDHFEKPERGQTVHAYLGIDSGSTTTKFVLMDEDENILDSFYAPNEGNPLDVAKKALISLRDSYREAGVGLDIIAVGTTGYGELLFAEAFGAECLWWRRYLMQEPPRNMWMMPLLFWISAVRI